MGYRSDAEDVTLEEQRDAYNKNEEQQPVDRVSLKLLPVLSEG